MTKFRKLGRPSGHRMSMLRTMVSQLVKHERIETTIAKAKEIRRLADNMVQLGKEEAIETMVACSAMAFIKEQESKKEEAQSKGSKWAKLKRGGIIGAAALTGETLLAITGGLAAPAIAAGLGALAPTLGTLIPVIGASGFAAAASAAGTVAGSVAVAASFGESGPSGNDTSKLLNKDVKFAVGVSSMMPKKPAVAIRSTTSGSSKEQSDDEEAEGEINMNGNMNPADAKRESQCAARRAASFVRGDDVLHKLFTELAYRYKDRAGGYTRLLRTRIRVGDAAPMAYIEIIDRENELRQSKPPTPQPPQRAPLDPWTRSRLTRQFAPPKVDKSDSDL